eukprot:2500365-Lingulodinium_polyedra.AAC.1
MFAPPLAFVSSDCAVLALVRLEPLAFFELASAGLGRRRVEPGPLRHGGSELAKQGASLRGTGNGDVRSVPGS